MKEIYAQICLAVFLPELVASWTIGYCADLAPGTELKHVKVRALACDYDFLYIACIPIRTDN